MVAAQERGQAVRVVAGEEREQGPLVLAEAAEDVREQQQRQRVGGFV